MTGYRIGVAAHGNRVAAALVAADDTVVATTEGPMPADGGPAGALAAALDPLLLRAARIEIGRERIDRVMLAVADTDILADTYLDEDRAGWPDGLGRVAVVRLGAATTAVPPLALWPPILRARISVGEACLTGGATLAGGEFEQLDRTTLIAFARGVAGRASAVAIIAVFSSVTPAHELAAAAILREELGRSVPILLSHEFAELGLIERENTTVLQAALTAPAVSDAARLIETLAERGLDEAELFLMRGDATLATLDYATTHPLLLRGSADAATVRGVATLAGQTDALVVLTADGGAPRAVCAVAAGAPRMTSGHGELAGVPIALREVAMVPLAARDDVLDLYRALDRVKAESDDLPLLVAGPGARSFMASLPEKLPGTTGVTCPSDVAAAAAIGAATAPVSAQARRIIALNDGDVGAVRAKVCDAACAAAMRAGADPAGVAVTEIDETPMAYLSEPAVALRVRAAGPPRTGWLSGGQGMRVNGRSPASAPGLEGGPR